MFLETWDPSSHHWFFWSILHDFGKHMETPMVIGDSPTWFPWIKEFGLARWSGSQLWRPHDLVNSTGSQHLTQHFVGVWWFLVDEAGKLPSSITAIFRKSVWSTWGHQNRLENHKLTESPTTSYNHQISAWPCVSKWYTLRVWGLCFLLCSVVWPSWTSCSIISTYINYISQSASPSPLGRDWKSTKSI